jgi:hypothetical protein
MMFVLNPDPYLMPCYRISPFETKDINSNNLLPQNDGIDDYCKKRFHNRHFYYTADGRKAINIAFQQYDLQKDDVVTIFTTSGNLYISSCVTNEIEKFCRWSRKMEEHTKLIFVNHEFGYPFKDLEQLKKYNLPIIEDCAHSFFSTDTTNHTGNAGDFVIYSFPKIFPLQIGGLLVSQKNIPVAAADVTSESSLQYIKNVASHYVAQKETIISDRLQNYQYLLKKLPAELFEERFALAAGIVPGVFLFKVKNPDADLVKLKQHLYAHGIQCSVFYGEQSFFIPVHQKLEKADLDYFAEVIGSFFNSSVK